MIYDIHFFLPLLNDSTFVVILKSYLELKFYWVGLLINKSKMDIIFIFKYRIVRKLHIGKTFDILICLQQNMKA